MSIPGLLYQENILDEPTERQIVDWIDRQSWSNALSRRTQHYGYEYNYRSRGALNQTTPLNGPILDLADWLKSTGVMSPQQCIINEYYKNQGIAAHTDSSSFGPVVVSFSLLEPCNMTMSKGSEKIRLTLAPRSILILSGEARSVWKHEIKGTSTVTLANGSTYSKPENYRRISLTYRTLA